MATSQDLKIRYIGDASGVQKTLGSLDKAHASFASKLSSIGKKAVSAGKTLSIGLTVPIVAFGKTAISEFADMEHGIAQTAAVLKSTGGAARVTEQDIGALATRIGKLSVQDDEAVRSAENLLLTFTNIRNKVHGEFTGTFNRATYAVADIAAAMGTDLNSAAIQVGKALNDPVKGLTALTRVGVTFTDEQQRQIAQLVKHNKAAEAQAIILDELNKEFGGSAKAAGRAASPMQRLSVAFGNFAETAGAIVVPVIEKLTTFLTGLMDRFNAASPSVQRLALTFAAIAAAVGPALLIFGKLAGALSVLAPLFTVTATAESGATVATFGLNTALLGTIATVGLIVAAIGLLALVIVKNWATIKRWTLAAWGAIRGAIVTAWHAITGFLRPALAALAAIWRTYWGVLKSIVQIAWNTITRIIIPAVRGILSFLRPALHLIAAIWKTAWGGMSDAFGAVFRGLVGLAKPALNGIISLINLVIHAVNALIHGFNAIPFHDDVPTIPTIPHLARGGRVFSAGSVLVGERGPELLRLPRGATVAPIASSSPGAGHVGDVYVNVNVSGPVVGSMRELAQEIRRELLRVKGRSGALGLA